MFSAIFAFLSWANTLLPEGIAQRLYVIGVLVCTIYGLLRGLGAWLKWLDKRERMEIKPDLFKGIVNIAVDSGMFVFNVASQAVAAGGVAATFPISIPVIILMQNNIKKTDEAHEE